MLAARGFSLASGLLSVAALSSLLLVPLPLESVQRSVARTQSQLVRRCLLAAQDHFSARALARVARETKGAARSVGTRPGTATSWTALARGISHRSVPLVSDSGDRLRLEEVRLDPQRADLKVIYAPRYGTKRASVETLARKAKAIAAVNANYFGDNGKPLGYLKVGGLVVVPSVATGSAFTGVFVMQGNRATILARDDYKPGDGDIALQAGPRLIAHGKITAGLRETRSFRQSGIAVTQQGWLVLYATDGSYQGLTWDETRNILMGEEARGGIQPRDVLNLDGGSSSQLYVDGPQGVRVNSGLPTPVPVALGFFTRPGK